MSRWANWTYETLKATNDARAIRNRRIGKRLWNRLVGRATRRLFK